MRLAALSLTLTAALSAPAFAASPEEALVRSWLQGVSFGLPVDIGVTSWDAARRTVSLETVTIGKPGGAFVLSFDDITVESPRRTSEGRFAARLVAASGMDMVVRFDPGAWFPEFIAWEQRMAEATPEEPDGDVVTPDEPIEPSVMVPVDVHYDVATLRMEAVDLPMASPSASDGATLVGRMIEVARWLMGWNADWIEMAGVKVSTRGAPEMVGETSYDHFYYGGIHDGRVERFGFSGMRQVEPVDGEPVVVTLDSAEGVGIDVRAALETMDPAAFKGGIGDGLWRTVMQSLEMSGLAIEPPGGGRIAIGLIAVDGARMRQTDKPLAAVFEMFLRDLPVMDDPDPAKAEEDLEATLALAEDLASAALGLYGVDSVHVADFSIEPPDETQRGGIDAVDIRQMDSSGIGSVTVRGVRYLQDDKPMVTLEHLGFNDLRFGSLDSWFALGMEGVAGLDAEGPSPDAMRRIILEGMPSLGAMEIAGLEVDVDGVSFSLGRINGTAGDYLGQLATRQEMTIDGLRIPVSAITDPTARDQLTAMGYQWLDIAMTYSARWDQATGVATIEDLSVTVEDMGIVSLNLVLGNLPLSLLDTPPEEMERRLMEMTIVSAEAVFGNHAIVERIFEQQAKPLNQDPVQFRKNFGGGMPLMLGFVGDQEIQKRLAPPLKAFFEDPKSLVLTLKPAAPVPVSAFEGMEGTPGQILKLLGMELEANR